MMKNLSVKLFSLMLALLLALCACAPAAAPAEPDPTEAVAAEPTAEPVPEPTAEPAPAEPTAEPEPEVPAVSGTFAGSGSGNNAAINVEVVLNEGVIAAVNVLPHSETAKISDAAFERIPAAIVAENSLAVDVVAGATASSRGIIAAAAAALTEAGVNVNDYYVADNTPNAVETIHTEVLVIGAGASGLAAGIKATENGADVLVIDKNATVVANATALSGGGFIGPASKLQKELGVSEDSAEQAFADLKAGGIDNIEYLLKLYTDNAGATVDWLYYDLGLPVAQKMSSHPEHKYARSFSFEGGAMAITTTMSEKLMEMGGELMMETKAESLIVENGKVVGAKAVGLDADYEIRAEKVILSTGGYGANPDLLPESVSNVLYYGPAVSTGDGLLMAQAIGADTVYLDHVKIYAQGIEIAPGKGAVATGGSMNATAKEGAIYVDLAGQRIINENGTAVSKREVTLQQPDACMYIVMDKPAFDLWVQATVNYKFMTQEQIDKFVAQNGGTPLFAHADTIEEAAKIAGIDPTGLAATVEEWNAICDAGVDEEFGNTMLHKIDDGPFYIVEQKLRFASTLGGLVVDETFRVLNTDGAVIEGLYASGELVGGAHGQDSMPTCNVGWALTSGRLAGESVSK